MNIAFFLIPKAETVYVSDQATMRQTLEKMEYHRYTAVPLIDKDGHYVGTLTEGDLLWYMKKNNLFTIKNLESIPISQVPRRVQNKTVSVHAEIEELLNLTINQNFVPVTDDQNIFIGIVTRKAILSFILEKNHAKTGSL